MESTGARLTEKLEELGMSKLRLSELSGVGYKTVCRICNGDRLGNLDTWIRFADALGCGVGEIIDD